MKAKILILLAALVLFSGSTVWADTIDFSALGGGGTWSWNGGAGALSGTFLGPVTITLTSGGSTITLTGSSLSLVTGLFNSAGGGTFSFNPGGSITVTGTALTCGTTGNPPSGNNCLEGSFNSLEVFNNAGGNTITFTGNIVIGVVDNYIYQQLGIVPGTNQNIVGSISGSLSGQLTQNQQNSGTTASTDLLATPVPEPGSLLLLGTGLSGLAGLFRKKLRK